MFHGALGGRRGIVALLLLACALVVPTVASAPVAHAADPHRILLVGDSVTHGSAGDWTWRYRLWQHLRSTGTEVDFVGPRTDLFDNLRGASGSQDYLDPAFDRDHASLWGLTFTHNSMPIGELVRTYQPDIVVEMLGLNDIMWQGLGPAQMDRAVRDFVAEARAADPGIDIVLAEATPWWMGQVAPFNASLPGLASELSTATSRVTVAHTAAGYDRQQDTWDAAHASSRGEVKIAAAVAQALAGLGVGAGYVPPAAPVPLGPRVPPVLAGTEADGEVTLGWQGPPGASSHFPRVRDATAGQAWDWARSGGEPLELRTELGSWWTAGALENNHRYRFRVVPAKGWHRAEPDAWSDTVTLIPHDRTAFDLTVRERRDHRVALDWPRLRAWSYRVRQRVLKPGRRWRTVRTITSDAVVLRPRRHRRYAYRVVAQYTDDRVGSVRRRVRVH